MKLFKPVSFNVAHNNYFRALYRIVFGIMIIASICNVSIAQVNNTGQLYIAGNMYANSSFVNAFGATYQNDGTFYLTGDFTNNQASMAEGAGSTQFIGTSLQNISGTQTPVFHDVYLNNSSGVQMNINTTMGATISTVAGSLYFNGYALTMGGKISTTYTNTSAFNVTNTSDLNITGAAATGNNIYFASSAHTLHDLSVSSGASGVLGNALDITAGISFGTVTVNGSFNANNFLTLKSDSNGTSRIAQSSGSITNFVTVERYIPPRRAWRFFCAPTTNDTLTIRSAWQEGVNNPSLYVRYNPHPGYGTQITGDNNTANGFDYNTTYNPSIKTWVNSTNNWSITAPPTVSTLLKSYRGYCFFIRGSRAVDLAQATNAIPDPTVIRETGTINNGAWSDTNTSLVSGNMIVVGNPYASSVDISSMLSSSTGIYSNKFWLWDPALSGIYGVGGYVVYSNGVMVPITPNYPAPTTIIQSEQAFLVQTNNTTAVIKFKQTDKTPSESNVFDRQASPFPVIYTNLMTPVNGTLALADAVAAGFSNRFSDSVDSDDAAKIWNFNENMAIIRAQKPLAIEFRPIPQSTDTLFLRLYLRQQPYTLQIFVKNQLDKMPVKAWLIDKYLNTKNEVSLYDTTSYSFSPNPDTNSYRNRFILVFNRLFVERGDSTKNVASRIFNTLDDIDNTTGKINVYPNPVSPKEKAALKLDNISRGNYEIALYNLKGQKLYSNTIQHNGGNSNYAISFPSNLSNGIYNLQLISSNGNIAKSIQVIINKN